jgi:hypothetical protein
MLGGNARRLYGIEPRLVVTQAPDEYEPVTMSRYAQPEPLSGSTPVSQRRRSSSGQRF